jgi:VWFA-related protein
MKTFAIATVVATLSLASQDPQPPRPTFKTGVDVVPVDVSVVDRSGRPVSDLAAADFVLTVDGKPRRIASAQYISFARPTEEVPAAPLHYTSNEAATGGRLVALVIDQGNIGAGTGKLAIDAAKRFIGGLNQPDRVALYTIPGAGPRIGFTASHAIVQRLLDKIVGTAVQYVGPHNIGITEVLALERNDQRTLENLIDRECPSFPSAEELAVCRAQLTGEARVLGADVRARTRESLLALRELMERLAEVPSPKTVVLLSEGLLIERQLSELTWVATLAARAQISLYVLQLEPPIFDAANPRASATRMADIDLAQQGLGYLTGLARGSVFRISAGADFAFARISHELSGYYLLSFEPEPGDRDGKSHKIKIEVPGRKSVLVRSRAEFSVDAARARNKPEILGDTLRSPLIATDIRLKVATYNFFDPETKKLKIVIASEIDRSLNPGANVSLAYALLDSKGALAANDAEAEIKAPIGSSGTQIYMGAAMVPSDVYTLKIAVLDDAGKRGSVEHAFRAQLESAGQVRIGGLLLAERLNANTPMRPAVGGEFSTDTLHAYLELYSEAEEQLKNASVVVEIAQSHDSPALDTAAANFHDSETPGMRIAESSVTIGLLPPGDYVARAVVNVFGRKAGQIVRPFRIVKKNAERPPSR